jgi:hypothetical protein
MNIRLDKIFLALLPFGVARVAQLIEQSLHGGILDRCTGFEVPVTMLSGIRDAAQL